MKAETLSVILTLVHLLLVHGLDTGVLQENNKTDSKRRVLYGQIADPADFRFIVRIEKSALECGGAVISNYFILTAAHCIFNSECSAMKIFPSNWLDGETSRVHIEQCFPHPQYKDSGLTYDIGLIETLDDLLEDADFTSIPLPAPGTRYPPGTPTVVVGWGLTEERIYPGRLFHGGVQVEDWDKCNFEFRQVVDECKSHPGCPVGDIPRRAICTRGQSARPSGTCEADSGGPVVINGVLAGVVNGAFFDDGVCIPGSPSIHANVADFLPWIYSITEPSKDTSQFPVTVETS